MRFAEVIQKAGAPDLVYLWSDPAKNRDFQFAIRQDRVMTLHQPSVGSRKDFGVVGFHPGKGVSYLRFPKPLTEFKESRIIGIKYDLLNSPPTTGPRVKPKATSARPFKPYIWTASQSQVDHQQKFTVTLRFTAKEDVTTEVGADSRKAAIEAAKRQAKVPQFSAERIATKVLKVRKVD